MRILMALHQFYPEFSGGTERVALNLAKAAQRSGHYVQVLAATIAPATAGSRPSATLLGALDRTYQGVPTTLIPRESLPGAADFSFEADEELTNRITAWLRQNHFDLVHVLHPMRMGSLILAAQRCRIPYLLTLTDFFSSCFLINRINLDNQFCQDSNAGRRCASDCLLAPWTSDGLERRHRQAHGMLASAGLRVCPSEYVARHYREEFRDLEFKVVPHGVNVLAMQPSATLTPRQRGASIALGFVGTIIPQKGLDILLQAVAKVADPNLRLLIAGRIHGDTCYAKKIHRLVSADVRVEMLGHLPTTGIADLMRTLDLFCLPSQVPETYSLALHEAAAAGVPALVSALGAPGEYVGHHGGGLCLPPDNIDAWAKAIEILLAKAQTLNEWRTNLPLPLRVEEEAFFYESLYRQICLEAGENS